MKLDDLEQVAKAAQEIRAKGECHCGLFFKSEDTSVERCPTCGVALDDDPLSSDIHTTGYCPKCKKIVEID